MKGDIYRFMSQRSCYPRHNKNLNVLRYASLLRRFPRLVSPQIRSLSLEGSLNL
jgi:hypothetical protein